MNYYDPIIIARNIKKINEWEESIKNGTAKTKEIVAVWDQSQTNYQNFICLFEDGTSGWCSSTISCPIYPLTGYWTHEELIDQTDDPLYKAIYDEEFSEPMTTNLVKDGELSWREIRDSIALSISATEQGPKDNQGRDSCWWCNETTRHVIGMSNTYQVCQNSNCNHFEI